MNNRPTNSNLNDETASFSFSDLEDAQRELFEGSDKAASEHNSQDDFSLRGSAEYEINNISPPSDYENITLIDEDGETIFAEPEIASNYDDVTLINEQGKTPFDELFEKLENNNPTIPSPKRSPSPAPLLRKSLSEENVSSSSEDEEIKENNYLPNYAFTKAAFQARLHERLKLLKEISNLYKFTWKADQKELAHIAIWSTLLSAAIIGVPLSLIIKGLTHNKNAAKLTPIIAGIKGGITMTAFSMFCTKNYPKNSAKLRDLMDRLGDNMQVEREVREEMRHRGTKPR